MSQLPEQPPQPNASELTLEARAQAAAALLVFALYQSEKYGANGPELRAALVRTGFPIDSSDPAFVQGHPAV